MVRIPASDAAPVAGVSNLRRLWTVQDDRDLHGYVLAGLTAPEIAVRIGRTREAISARLGRLGLRKAKLSALPPSREIH